MYHRVTINIQYNQKVTKVSTYSWYKSIYLYIKANDKKEEGEISGLHGNEYEDACLL
jgi:hypothetical protein